MKYIIVCDFRYYNAVVDMLSGDGETCTVSFEGYGTTVIVRLSDLRPRGWEEEEEEGSGLKKKKIDSRPNAKYVNTLSLMGKL